MVSLGYKQSQRDHTSFIKHSVTGKLTLLMVFVDDIIIAGHDKIEKLALKEKVAAQFYKYHSLYQNIQNVSIISNIYVQ